jgi:hypothetical protein
MVVVCLDHRKSITFQCCDQDHFRIGHDVSRCSRGNFIDSNGFVSPVEQEDFELLRATLLTSVKLKRSLVTFLYQ